MRSALGEIEPELLWNHFDRLRTIPRCSKKEAKAAEYVISVAQRLGLEYGRDDAGNVTVKKPATPGLEDSPIIALQAHLDMVCEKNKDVDHDFAKDPIEIGIEGDRLHARGTTLGADNGIGVSAMLAVLEDESAVHGPLELLFTVDEEEGMSGAYGLEEDALQGRLMINLDTDQVHALYVGCAGGENSNVHLPVQRESARGVAFRVALKGLRGGHSGVEIHLERGNAIKLLGRLLWEANETVPFQLSSIEGGKKHNAIPREAEALVLLPEERAGEFKARIEEGRRVLQREYRSADPGLEVEVLPASTPETVLSAEDSQKVLDLLMVIPSGIMRWSPDIEDLVESSMNLSIVETREEISFLVSARSSSETQLASLTGRTRSVARLAGARVAIGDSYPAWHPDLESRILRICKEAHMELFGEEPEVKAIHAGLEAGIIKEKFSGMDVISMGPLIVHAHSPEEWVSIASVQELYSLLLRSLSKASEISYSREPIR